MERRPTDVEFELVFMSDGKVIDVVKVPRDIVLPAYVKVAQEQLTCDIDVIWITKLPFDGFSLCATPHTLDSPVRVVSKVKPSKFLKTNI